jgi:hypothetical protein
MHLELQGMALMFLIEQMLDCIRAPNLIPQLFLRVELMLGSKKR